MNARVFAASASLLAVSLPAAAEGGTLGMARMMCPPESSILIHEETGEELCAPEEEAQLTPMAPRKQVQTGLIIEEHPYESGYHPMPRFLRAHPIGLVQADPGADSSAGAFEVSDDVYGASSHFVSPYGGDLFGWATAEAGGSFFASAPGYSLVTRYDSVSTGADYSVDDADASVYGSGLLGFDLARSDAGLLASAPFDSVGGSVYLIDAVGTGWTPVDTAAVASVESASAGAAFGYRILAADVDGDGEDDLIASAPGESRVFVFLGALDTLDGLSTNDADAVLVGSAESFAGYDLDTVTDASGAVTHLLVGAPGADSAYVVAVADVALGGALDVVSDTVLSGDGASRFGHRVRALGGGVIAVASPEIGLVEAFRADNGALVGLLSGSASARFGADVSVVDADGDGVGDVAAAARDGEDVAVSALLSSSLD